MSPPTDSALLRSFTTQLVSWQCAHQELTEIRMTVFVHEQSVPPEIEIDPLDADAAKVVHVVARDALQRAIATGRLLLDREFPRIGRMAVLKPWRGAGVGAAMLELLCEEAKRRGHREVHLNAQSHATAFYYHHGFLSHGVEFVEAGIAHQAMRRAL